MNIHLCTKIKTPSLILNIIMVGALFTINIANANKSDLEQINNHNGLTAEFIDSIKNLGFDSIENGELLALKEYGVTVPYINKIRDLGFTNIELGELIAFKEYDINAS